MSELKPCPFCGNHNLEEVVDDGIHWVKCCSCGATGPTNTRYSGEEDSECIDWNTRHESETKAQAVYILFSDTDGTTRSSEEFVAVVKTEKEAEDFLKLGYGYSSSYKKIEFGLEQLRAKED